MVQGTSWPDYVSGKVPVLFSFRYLLLVRESTLGFARAQKLKLAGKSSSSECFCQSFGVGSDALSWKGNHLGLTQVPQRVRGASPTGLIEGAVPEEGCVNFGERRYR